jgi:TPR repeat protein
MFFNYLYTMFMTAYEIAELEYGLKDIRTTSTIIVSHTDSIILCLRASKKGHLDAMYDIGCYYYYGYSNFFDKNVNYAMHIWKIAASKGHVRSSQCLLQAIGPGRGL